MKITSQQIYAEIRKSTGYTLFRGQPKGIIVDRPPENPKGDYWEIRILAFNRGEWDQKSANEMILEIAVALEEAGHNFSREGNRFYVLKHGKEQKNG